MPVIKYERYICCNCGNVFEHPKVLFGYNPSYPRDSDCPNEYVCPQCESDDYEDADECVECGDIKPSRLLEYGLCRSCIEQKAKEHAAEFVLNDREIRDAFAWWLHTQRRR